ncbi:hypothetical protein MCC01958_00270 [Bifidobacteriaceae bacterium MCC01958]|nr:hypothetical protein MCC01958_00270 [Bifidobacteriaceae bacterium MCC01958]
MPDGTLHADNGHRPVRVAMPDMVSPLRTVTLTSFATEAGAGTDALAEVTPSRRLTICMTRS